jgi:uncharacterized protein YkwD
MSDFILKRRHLLRGCASLSALAILSACTSSSVLAPVEAGNAADATDSALPLVNTIRAAHGLKPLFNDGIAATAAREQALRMASYGKMAHDLGPDKSFLLRMKRLDVVLPAAENIAAGQDDVPAAVTAWKNSTKHLENMLGPYHGLGVALARNPGSGDRPYWSMVLSSADRPIRLFVKGA